MSKWRKKPVEIEAVKLSMFNHETVPQWWYDALQSGDLMMLPDGRATIRTLEGLMSARPDDWIIRGVKGELYPCKNDIFEETYEPVE